MFTDLFPNLNSYSKCQQHILSKIALHTKLIMKRDARNNCTLNEALRNCADITSSETI